MKRLFLILLTLNSFLFCDNMFVITNADGSIAKKSKVTHKENRYFDDLVLEQERLLKALKKIKSNHTSYDKDNILDNAKEHLGGKYVWGGTQPKGFDCSGYMKYLYEKEGIEIPRTAYAQSKVGLYVTRGELKKGDLLFFLTDKKRNIPVTHVGMYLGDDQFIHAASKKAGIIISSLSKSKYNKIFVKAKRIIQ